MQRHIKVPKALLAGNPLPARRTVHHEIWKYYQSTLEKLRQSTRNLRVHLFHSGLPSHLRDVDYSQKSALRTVLNTRIPSLCPGIS